MAVLVGGCILPQFLAVAGLPDLPVAVCARNDFRLRLFGFFFSFRVLGLRRLCVLNWCVSLALARILYVDTSCYFAVGAFSWPVILNLFCHRRRRLRCSAPRSGLPLARLAGSGLTLSGLMPCCARPVLMWPVTLSSFALVALRARFLPANCLPRICVRLVFGLRFRWRCIGPLMPLVEGIDRARGLLPLLLPMPRSVVLMSRRGSAGLLILLARLGLRAVGRLTLRISWLFTRSGVVPCVPIGRRCRMLVSWGVAVRLARLLALWLMSILRRRITCGRFRGSIRWPVACYFGSVL